MRDLERITPKKGLEMTPNHILLIDIDGLRTDVFKEALDSARLPNIARLLGGVKLERGVFMPAVSSVPSITFCAQACLFTGAHPKEHGIPGNQFYDRFGTHNEGVPRYFAFDVGDVFDIDDGLAVFTNNLAGECLQKPTIYEKMAQKGWRSVVAGQMYAGGAQWLKPSMLKLGRFLAGGEIVGLESEEYDSHLLEQLLQHIEENGLDNITTLYFLGLDHESHDHGPFPSQADYLINHVDPMIGQLWEKMNAACTLGHSIFTVIFSDHGQVEVPNEDKYALSIGFPFGGELNNLFESLKLRLYDYPGKDPHCDAVVTMNGELADVYLRNLTGSWADIPQFERDVLSVGKVFWEAHQTGKEAPDLEGALAGVLVRNVERYGWQAPYEALTPEGSIISLAEWFAQQPADLYLDPVNRLNNLVSRYSGDLMLISDYAEGYYFGRLLSGIHGGLHPGESQTVLAYGWPDAEYSQWEAAKQAITQAIDARCQAEGGRPISIVDMLTGLEAVL